MIEARLIDIELAIKTLRETTPPQVSPVPRPRRHRRLQPPRRLAPIYPRVLRLTLLVPEIADADLYARHPTAMTLAVLMRPFAVGWDQERGAIGLEIRK